MLSRIRPAPAYTSSLPRRSYHFACIKLQIGADLQARLHSIRLLPGIERA